MADTCRPGFTVMLDMIARAGQEPEDAIQDVKGRTIESVRLDDEANHGDGALVFAFDDGWGLSVFDRGRSCCEYRYLKTDDDLGYYAGATLQEITVECGETTEGEYGECHEVQFLLVHTDRGIFTVNTHNEHSGYYGGFLMTADVTEPSESDHA